jgi:hypothetical protein
VKKPVSKFAFQMQPAALQCGGLQAGLKDGKLFIGVGCDTNSDPMVGLYTVVSRVRSSRLTLS